MKRMKWAVLAPAFAIGVTLAAMPAEAQVTREPEYRVQIEDDIPYAVSASDAVEGGYVDLLMDAYLPKGDAGMGRPAALLVHGGCFRFLGKDHYRHKGLGKFLARRGFACFSIDYRQVRDAPPAPDGYNNKKVRAAQYAAVMDAKAAVRWIRANNDQYGVDPNRVAVVGSSAGGSIAMALAITDDGDFAVDSPDDPTFELNSPDQPANVQAAVALWGNPSFYLHEVDAADAPLLFVHGVEDPNWDSPYAPVQKLYEALDAVGATYEFYPLHRPGHTHWDAEIDGLDIRHLILRFLLMQLGL